MTLSNSQLYRETFSAVLEFQNLRLWERLGNHHCIGLQVPGSKQAFLASVMGWGGAEYGLIVMRGENAAKMLLRMSRSEPSGDGFAEEFDLMGYSMTALHEISREGKKFLERARFSGQRDDIAPFFIAKNPGKHPREISRDEVVQVLFILKGLIKAQAMEKLESSPLELDADVQLLCFAGDPREPDIAFSRMRLPETDFIPPASVFSLPADVGHLPRLSSRWLVGLPVIPTRIVNDERTVRALVLADLEDGRLIKLEMVMAGPVRETTAILYRTFQGDNPSAVKGLPQELIFTDLGLFDAVLPALADVGVKCLYAPEHPLLEHVMSELKDFFLDVGQPLRGDREDSGALPAPNDLESWKNADIALSRQVEKWVKSERSLNARAAVRYFGSTATTRQITDGPQGQLALSAFVEWWCLTCRSVRNGPKVAEKMIAAPIPAAQKALLKARLQARPSIYRVTGIDLGRSLDMEDLIFGGTVRVNDRMLSESTDVETCLPALIFTAGDFHFLSVLGPPLGTVEVPDAVDFLEHKGLNFSTDGVSRDMHLFGRLWKWAEMTRKRRREKMKFVNFDGDPLLQHTASFTVANQQSVHAALKQREDLDFDESNGSYHWRLSDPRYAEKGAGFDFVTGGRISFVGGELLLDVNSERRFIKARAWLERIPGVKFMEVRTQKIDEKMEIPLDDRENEPKTVDLPPEAIEEFRSMMHKRYMQWLDMDIPALGGQTPREACRTEAGRRKVALMIRTYPTSSGMPGIEVPRKEMLGDLGLAEDYYRSS